ncbi:unnamed protein product [Brugia timori]|uniref:RING-type E3 ubiquitin transferase n=1 Tax=Brugia timori TaxID=42155 RepID=A0A0R3R721_9BILA|nr:unnamed protein product [Brugia timori]
MALLKAFQKQSEKKPCPICGYLVTRGLYRSHLNHCKLQPDDDDCTIIAEVCAKDRKREAVESLISSESSNDLFDNLDNEEISEESDDNRNDSNVVNNKEISTDANEHNQMAEIVMKEDMPCRTFNNFARKRTKKIKLENKSEMAQPSKTMASAALNEYSEYEKVENNQNKTKEFFHCKATTSNEIKLEIQMETGQNLLDTLENIKSYLNVCNCDLVKNTQILTYDKDATIEGAQVASPYYLTLFYKILKRVLCSGRQYGEAQFWGERLHLLEKFIALSGIFFYQLRYL